MFCEGFILLMMALGGISQYTPSTDAYALSALIPMLSATNFLFDGPESVTNAQTTPTSNLRPTLKQMMYYNYYAAAMYCQYQLSDLSCEYCKKFKCDVDTYKVIIDSDVDDTALVTLSTSRKEIVVTFRGSQNPWNVIVDVSMFAVCYPSKPCDIKLHAGFYSTAMSLYDKVVSSVGCLLKLHPSYKIVLCGHSLGGSVAHITTFFLLYLDQFPAQKYELYTFGETRVGNKAFVDFMNSQDITRARITARADIAPHFIPASVLGFPLLGDYYIHAQTEYWINGTLGQKFADPSVYEDFTCSNSMGPAYTLVDHFTYFDANYLICFADQPGEFAAIPGGILEPVNSIPPLLPQPISNFLGGLIGFVTNLLGPLLGR